MRSVTRNALRGGAATLVVLLAASMSAEVHRFTEETLTLLARESLDTPEVYAEPEAGGAGADRRPRAFSAVRLIGRLPQLATVVLAADGEAPRTVTAVFAVDPADGPLRAEIPLELGLVKVQGVYAVREEDRSRLAAWLGARASAFIAGEVVIDRIEGSDATPEVRVGGRAASGEPHAWSTPVESFGGGMEHMRGRRLRDVSFTKLGRGDEREPPAEIRFQDLVGDVVLVHVWATWCAPCLKKMPGLEALQATNRDRGLTIVNVSDEPAWVLREWLEQNPSAMLHGRRDDLSFLAGPGMDRRAGVPRPVYLVLDREGAVREVRVGAMAPDGSVQELSVLVERYL